MCGCTFKPILAASPARDQPQAPAACLDETPRHSSIRLQGVTLEDPPHESPRPPTLEASHLLTGPTGFEFSGLLRTIRRRARHRVTICRELKHSVQIVESEHVVTDRLQVF